MLKYFKPNLVSQLSGLLGLVATGLNAHALILALVQKLPFMLVATSIMGLALGICAILLSTK